MHLNPRLFTFCSSELTRRDFLKTAGAALGVLCPAGTVAAESAAPRQSTPPLVGSQLYGWGQYYERDHQSLSDHLDDALAAIRDCGYAYAEGSLNTQTPENNARFAERLRAKGLQPVCIYTGAHLHDPATSAKVIAGILRAAKVCREAGFSVINCNCDPIGREKTETELEHQVASLKTLGTGLNELGLRLGIHHHTPEMTNHAREFHYNFRHTDPGVVGFCYDVHWVYRGGIQPSAALAEYGDRVVSWHLRQSRGGTWWEDLDSGDVDYEAVAKFAQAHRLAARYAVELALENGTRVTRSAVENHKRSREFVRRIFGC